MFPIAWLESAINREHRVTVRVVSSHRKALALRFHGQAPQHFC